LHDIIPTQIMLHLIADVLLSILAPILIMILIGALLRWKLRIDVTTLGKLNIYLFVPVYVFEYVSTSPLSWDQMAGIFGITVLQVATLGAIIWAIGRTLKISRKTLAAIALAVMFYNSGNYGLPLAQLAYPDTQSSEWKVPSSKLEMPSPTRNSEPGTRNSSRKSGAPVQTFVMMAQNLLVFTVGMAIAASAHTGGLGKGLATLLRLPILPALACGILAQYWLKSGHHLPIAISKTSRYIADGLIPLALVTLGAQLATNPRWPRWKPVGLVLVLRLIGGPLQMAALLYLLHKTGPKPMDLWPWPAELLILTASVPTAVNTLLLTLEIGGDADLAADCVFWTTVVSCVTITGWLILLRSGWWFG
jgi:predicted permease